jgi:iron(III) transport system permease protein
MILKPRNISIYIRNPWMVYLLIATLAISIPLLVISGNFFTKGGEIWQHIYNNLVPGYSTNTFLLMTGVAALTFALGVSSSWIVTMYRFPGHRFFEWALILPIALPAYISGFTWAGILEYTSPVYSYFRNTWGFDTGQYLFFDVMSLPGAILVFALALYPYVYLLTRAYFLTQSRVLFEVTASMGMSPGQSFRKVALPMARPAIVAGVTLALMEVLNDYGLVKYFGIDTFTTGIFNAWFAFGNLNAALKLSGYLMAFVLLLIIIERWQRGEMRFDMGMGGTPLAQKNLRGLKSTLAIVIVSIPVLFGFLFPFAMILHWTSLVWGDAFTVDFWILLRNSFILASLAAVTVVIIAVFVAYTARTYPLKLIKMAARFSTLGYALPGAVVAIGILVVIVWLESGMRSITSATINTTLVGTGIILIYAYLVRFIAIGYNSIESGSEKISINLDQASRSLGITKLRTMLKIHLPLIRNSLIAAVLLVFIDVLKELPLTLILRPFNFDTLAIRAFEYASDERLAEAAPAAVIIALTGLVPVYLLNKMMKRGKT